MKKNIFLGLLVLVAALVGACIYFYSNLDFYAQKAIETFGTAIVQAPVKVQGVKLSPAQGEGAIQTLVLGNPAGFKTSYAAKFNAIKLGIEPSSLTQDVIVIRNITVLAPHLVYESGSDGSNFDVIQRHVNQYLGSTKKQAQKPSKKIIIDQLLIRDAKLSYSPALMQGKTVDVALPEIALRHLGRNQGGLTPGELSKVIVDALVKQTTQSIGKKFTDGVTNSAKGLRDSVKGWWGK